MNEAVQGKDPMREEELYALLDRAMTEERLQVSEALIQKTLQRVKEENSTTVIPFEKKAGKRNRMMQYACVAAAAVFVLAIGVRTVNGGKFTAEDAQMKSRELAVQETEAGLGQTAYDLLADAAGSGVTDDGIHYYCSTSESDSERGSDAIMEAPEAVGTLPKAESRGGENVMTGVTMKVSDGLTEMLADAGMTVKTGEAEYWEFVTSESDWEKELGYALRAGTVVKSELPESGSFSYALNGKDGSQWNIQCNEPLDAVVCVKTEQGVLWGLLGESCSFYMK